MNLQHKTQKSDIQFFVLIPNTYIQVRDKVKFNKLVSKNSLCHDVFDLGFKDITGITFYQIIPVKILLMDKRIFGSISSTTDIKFSTPFFKLLETRFPYLNTINDFNGFTMFTYPENKFNKSVHVVWFRIQR